MSHRFFFKLIFILLFALSIEKTLAQTTLNGGDVSGELLKSGSPYIVKATITVPKGKTLVVKPGVQILFDGAYNLNVEGSLQALGTAAQPIVFTAKDTNNGWRGIQIFKNEQGADSNLFEHCTFSYTYQITPDPWRDFGAVLLDSVDNVRFSFCDFFNNTSLSGGAVRLFYSTCRINDCEFVRNRAYDSNSTHPAQGYGPYGSCIVSNFSDVEIKSSNFKFNMSIAPDYIDYNETARASGLVGFDGNRVKILDCLFENNFCDAGSIIRYGGSYYDELKLDTFWMERCVVKNNKIRDKEILALNGSYSNHVRFYVRDCDFIENECLDGLSGSVVLCFNNNGGSNDMVVDNCKLINNKMAQGIFISQGVHGTYSNSLIAGQRGYGIFITQSTKVYVVNSLIHNNWRGFYSFFNSDINLLNSVIAFNGRIDSTKPFPEFENGAPWSYSYGLGVGNRGQLNLYNSIVQDNKDYLGGVANFIGSENREPFP
ncbi:MAG: right-handed parallel beta-helix repeat-containing protein [Bacteroidia bacterium]